MAKVLENIESKVLTSDDACPPLAAGKLRVIMNRWCPFAERAVLACALKDIPCEAVNVHLRRKPTWFVELNPLGATPTLVRDGVVIYDSPITVEWLDAVYAPANQILPADPNERAKQRMTVERLSAFSGLFYANLRDPSTENVDKLKAVLKLMNEFLVGDYLSGASFGWVDIMTWTFLERVPVLDRIHEQIGIVKFIESDLPRLAAYATRVRAHPKLAKYIRSVDNHTEFMKSQTAGAPNFDLGL